MTTMYVINMTILRMCFIAQKSIRQKWTGKRNKRAVETEELGRARLSKINEKEKAEKLEESARTKTAELPREMWEPEETARAPLETSGSKDRVH